MSDNTSSPRSLMPGDNVHLHDDSNTPFYGRLSNKPYPLGDKWVYRLEGGRLITTSNIAEKCTYTPTR